jgi:hypothetical protein
MTLMNSCWAQVQAIPQLRLVHPTLKAAMIVALTAMVELFGVLAPSLAESTRQHRGAMNTVFKIASTFSEPAYCNRDPALAVSDSLRHTMPCVLPINPVSSRFVWPLRGAPSGNGTRLLW